MALSGGDSTLSWSVAYLVSAPELRACRQAKPPLSLPQTSLPCLVPLLGAFCPPEPVKWNARPHSPPGPSWFGVQGCGMEVLLTGAGGTRPCLGSQEQGQALRWLCCQSRAEPGSLLWDQSVPFSWAAAFRVQAAGLPFPSHVSDGLKQELCSNPPEAAQKLPALPPPGVHPAPASPPAPKGYCPSISGLHPARPQRCSRSRCPQPRAEACPAWLLLGQDMLAPCLSPPQP